MTSELGIRDYELGMPPTHPRIIPGVGEGGWEFLIPNSYFLIRRPGGLR